jgi:signal transduction histidine kinase
MRRFANDVLEAANIEVDFRAAEEPADIPLNADERREIFLVFKESVNNIARHARCSHVDIVLNLKRSQLVMTIHDNGQGFRDEPCHGQGYGLASMRERARRLGGALHVTSESGRGTTLVLRVPLAHVNLSVLRGLSNR